MTLDLLARPAPLRSEPDPATSRSGSSSSRWAAWRRQRAQAAGASDAAERAAVLGRVATCLEQTAQILEQGWTQGRWYVLAPPSGQRRGLRRLNLTQPAPGTAVAACLLGAVVQAAGESPSSGSVARRTVDVLWEVLQQPPAPDLPAFRRVCPPQERAVRARELMGWNDAPQRARQEVLGLVEAARCRALTAAARC